MDKLFIIVLVLGVLLVILTMFKSYLENKNLHPTNEFQPIDYTPPLQSHWYDIIPEMTGINIINSFFN